ncbi:WD40 repeat-like protein [Lindgomyces ingoldianus]|uniref:WD40 repeat-like protein n=1 Tax=Lindgomyces ingoldianus TaxID=673940 RepID=A0ACB6RAW3_9PLEO|nr:WD40 repeat-like protein [Lindgomyces ingoldianus]KAF2476463.1 WD40 repeat-like protein [Lindgomyces ingoldianus]
MPPTLTHECTRVPVTALATHGPLLFAAEGPYLRLYTGQNPRHISTEQIFKNQTIHGISVFPKTQHHVILIFWGGFVVRALEIEFSINDSDIGVAVERQQLSFLARAADWILDIAIGSFKLPDSSEPVEAVCAAITAHNTLLELIVKRIDDTQDENEPTKRTPLSLHISDLRSSSRSILYSAHLLWESYEHILAAAGTAFGEIIVWSWTREVNNESYSCIHRIFLGHEGSIFGVHISHDLHLPGEKEPQRLLASCSDDRTIRVWDISDISRSVLGSNDGIEVQRTRHTGFSNTAFDSDTSGPTCLATGWGHLSRVWTIRFLDLPELDGTYMISAGEDATVRLWKLVQKRAGSPSEANVSQFGLRQFSTFAFHNGKNIWATTIFRHSSGLLNLISGAADSHMAACLLLPLSRGPFSSLGPRLSECSVQDIVSLGQPSTDDVMPLQKLPTHKSSKVADFIRSYAFIDRSSFILTTNSGKVYLETLASALDSSRNEVVVGSKLIDYREDMLGYSICTAEPSRPVGFKVDKTSPGLAFVAGSRGTIYAYQQDSFKLTKICTVQGKVGSMFTKRINGDLGSIHLVLLVTLVGQKVARLFFVDYREKKKPTVSRTMNVPLSELLTGFVITSMAYVDTLRKTSYLLLGFRRGSVAAYSVPIANCEERQASMIRIIDKAHGKETVTAMMFMASQPEFLITVPSHGHLYSVGRDGCLAIHYVDFNTNSVTLVHNLAVPVGPNLEGIYYDMGSLMVYGFSSTKFVLYNTTDEEERMSVETGGAHRSWSYQHQVLAGTSTLVWTRASNMHVCIQNRPIHQTIRSGGHGREIKTVAISKADVDGTSRQVIATGAEDTDIKIFDYVDGDINYLRTLRKHTTGIQHLQWSGDGKYLFSSGGCEEFYVWRVRILPRAMTVDLLAVCESICEPESEHSDLRIMSFDVRRESKKGGNEETVFVIAMVFSDSTIKVYSHSPTAAVKWHLLAKGVYFTSCLTQCIFLSSTSIMTAGTDGHAVLWPLPSSILRPHTSDPQPPQPLAWKDPAKIHQNTSKALASASLGQNTTLVVSGGDDCSLSFLLTSPSSTDLDYTYNHPPIIVLRAHASAVTACAILQHHKQFFVVTCGNDQCVRLWEVVPNPPQAGDALEIKRIQKITTSVADVSSMDVLWQEGGEARVLICGVGVEIIRIDWDVSLT